MLTKAKPRTQKKARKSRQKQKLRTNPPAPPAPSPLASSPPASSPPVSSPPSSSESHPAAPFPASRRLPLPDESDHDSLPGLDSDSDYDDGPIVLTDEDDEDDDEDGIAPDDICPFDLETLYGSEPSDSDDDSDDDGEDN